MQRQISNTMSHQMLTRQHRNFSDNRHYYNKYILIFNDNSITIWNNPPAKLKESFLSQKSSNRKPSSRSQIRSPGEVLLIMRYPDLKFESCKSFKQLCNFFFFNEIIFMKFIHSNKF